jgi:multidrug efflux pump subunit AcrA (membrane-fusion protein)
VQVKVEIDANAPAMPLGAAVTGVGRWREDNVVILPWTAMTSKDGQPAVWVVDPATQAVTLRPVVVDLYEKDKTVLRSGLQAGETVVTEGGKFLREGQIVRTEIAERS